MKRATLKMMKRIGKLPANSQITATFELLHRRPRGDYAFERFWKITSETPGTSTAYFVFHSSKDHGPRLIGHLAYIEGVNAFAIASQSERGF